MLRTLLIYDVAINLDTFVYEKGAKVIAEALKENTTIENLNLEKKQIGDEGAKAIGEMLKTNTSLKELTLGAKQK